MGDAHEPRPGAPVNAAIEVSGDRWSPLVLPDIVFADRRYFRELQAGSREGIASPILAGRLKRLLESGLPVRQPILVQLGAGNDAELHTIGLGWRSGPAVDPDDLPEP